MAHHINYNQLTGKHSFFSVKEKPWHGLGQLVEEYPTSREAIQYAGLNFQVEKRPLFTYNGSPEDTEPDLIQADIKVPAHFATVRTDTNQVLGLVGKDYHIVQNSDVFGFFDALVGGKDGILYETAGALGQGERIFITAKLPAYMRVGKDDLIEQYIFLTTSHDGCGSITAAFTPVRVVCSNTLNAALKNHHNCVKIRHTVNASERLGQAHRLLGLTNLLSNELEGIFNQWAKVRITDDQVKKLVQLAMAPSKEVALQVQGEKAEELSTAYQNIVSDVLAYAEGSPTQQDISTKGTLYGAYNAVTGYFQNVRNYRDDEYKFKSILQGGTAQQRSQAAFNLCNAFSKFGAVSAN